MSNEAIRSIPRRENPSPAQVAAAKAYGQEHGYEGRSGGWIYNAKGKAIAHGWQSFAAYLIAVGIKSVREAGLPADGPKIGVVMSSELGDDWRPSTHLRDV